MGCSPQYLYLGRVLGVEPQGRVPVHLAAGLQHALQLLVVPGQLERRTGTGLTAPPQGTGQQEQWQGQGRVGPRAAGSRAGGVKGSRAEGRRGQGRRGQGQQGRGQRGRGQWGQGRQSRGQQGQGRAAPGLLPGYALLSSCSGPWQDSTEVCAHMRPPFPRPLWPAGGNRGSAQPRSLHSEGSGTLPPAKCQGLWGGGAAAGEAVCLLPPACCRGAWQPSAPHCHRLGANPRP